jgi:plastocyanin
VNSRTRLVALAGAAAVSIALPAAADARTKSVNMGVPPKSGKALQEAFTDVNDFFPHAVTINVGDRIRFLPVGFHSFDLPPKGGGPLPLVAGTGETVAGSNDAAGAPFWFNGQDQLGFSGALLKFAFGKRLSYDGSKRRLSGLPVVEKPKPVTVTFKKAGRWTYYCNIHAGMKGIVNVRAKGRKVPSARADRRAIANQVARSLRTAKALAKKKAPAGVVEVGVAGSHGEEYLAMVPSAVTVPTGSTLNFRMSSGSYEVHTATAGPGDPERQQSSYLGQLAASFQSPVFDPRATYQSEPPATMAALTPALHGNGFWNSGLLDTSSDSPLPSSNAVTFGAPGKYDFYCLIHPFMKTTVTVQ